MLPPSLLLFLGAMMKAQVKNNPWFIEKGAVIQLIMQLLRLFYLVAELEKVFPIIGMVPEDEVDKMRNELVVLQNERAILERNLAGYRDMEEVVAMLKASITSLELDNTGFLDKIAMLEHGVRKLKSDLNESTLKNTYL
ncbi:unnamed protein product [Lactuca saligna]|uniref:Uncharacterized protein n=1 Tax=Lactuca saligna TaxID=75948 RepID=A0AA36E2R7_LACSI|nr:unnamed protein product [Lactuca saligna]